MSFANKVVLTTCLALTFPAFAGDASAQGIRNERTLSPIELKSAADAPAVKAPAAQKPAPEDVVDVIESEEPYIEIVPRDAPITVQAVSHISLDTLGLYDESKGGLPADVWNGSAHDRVVDLLTRLPDSIPSETLRRLVARLLLSSAKAPSSDNIRQTILRPRVETLLKLGEASQAVRLIDMAPKTQRGEAVNRLEFTANLLNENIDWVCEHVTAALAEESGNLSQWKKLSIFCQAKQGKKAEAQLALDLAQEQGVEFDAAFPALIDSLLGRTETPAKRFAAPLSLEDAALIAASGKDAFPEGYLAAAPIGVVKLVAESQAFPAATLAVAKKRLAELKGGERTAPQQAAAEFYRAQFALAADRRIDFDAVRKAAPQKSADAEQLRVAYRFYSLLQALGFSRVEVANPWVNAHVTESRTVIAPWLRNEATTAVRTKRKGEAILLLATLTGQVKTLAEVDDATLVAAVQSLVQLGLTEEAKALALESVVALY